MNLGTEKRIYDLGEGGMHLVHLLGGKGAGLAEMRRMGLPVPAGFTITTAECTRYLKHGRLDEGLVNEVREAMGRLEAATGKSFGRGPRPLLVSVRSGAPVSMPGMMDTVLNVGLNEETMEAMVALTGDRRFALDSMRRLMQMFGTTVLGIPKEEFDRATLRVARNNGPGSADMMDLDTLDGLVREFGEVYRNHGLEFPQDPYRQLFMSIEAVFRSWNSDRARAYREINGIDDGMGTAVNVVEMVFGNMGEDSATGVVFTRDPNTGEKRLSGEYLVNAQGEDVVAGIRTPENVYGMERRMPGAFRDLVEACDRLERHYRDMMDIEFTVERGRLYLLQTRVGKRAPRAHLRITLDMLKEGLISVEEAVMRVEPEHIEGIMHPRVEDGQDGSVICSGLAASPGVATGEIVFSSDRAIELSKQGRRLILVRPETTADDVRGMAASAGFLTQKGGMTSHAAVVARAMGKPAVVGAEEIEVDHIGGVLRARGLTLREGDVVTVDGTTGRAYIGEVRVTEVAERDDIDEFLRVCDSVSRLQVWANANTPEEVALAKRNGAKGIGLARTERMFLGNDRIGVVRAMIMSRDSEERRSYLDRLLPMQVSDFTEFFRTMEGMPVIIRLLDPPLHEFLPEKEEILERLSGPADGESAAELKKMLETVRDLEEFNPMLGFRGCRLGIIHREIYEMQVRAIARAALRVRSEGIEPNVEIMVPLVGHENEMKELREIIMKTFSSEDPEGRIRYKIGTMIEVPRACLVADRIAEFADFFSFGTNDLTQMTFGYSRDDAEGKFIRQYIERGILRHDPFTSIDLDGVGRLMKIGVELGRKTKRDLEIGICGEHGGDPESIEFCHTIGLDYVSASPRRIPVARLAAARAAIRSAMGSRES